MKRFLQLLCACILCASGICNGKALDTRSLPQFSSHQNLPVDSEPAWVKMIEERPLLSGYTLDRKAVSGAMGDCGITFAGLLLGAVELNPLGPFGGCALKGLMIHANKTLPVDERALHDSAQFALSRGGTANNACVILSIISGGSFAPACLTVFFVASMYAWKETQDEREFWEICAYFRRENPKLKCTYTPPPAKEPS
jgi:hypothetical protein